MTHNKYEEAARNYFTMMFGKNKEVVTSPNRYDFWDCSGSTYNTGQPYLAELKRKGCYHDTYETVLIEQHKYDSLMESYRQTGAVPFYINFYKDKSIVFNLTRHIEGMYFGILPLPKSTATDSGTGEFEDTPCYYFPYKSGKIINSGYTALDRILNK